MLVWYFTRVDSWVTLFTSAVTGVDNSSVPHPLGNLVFTLRIRACSITRSLNNPCQNLSLLRIVWNPFWHIRWTPGWVFGSRNIPCKYIYDDFSYRQCLDAAKNDIISHTVWRYNIQLLDDSAFRNRRSISIVCMYCNQRRDVFEPEWDSLNTFTFCATSKNDLEL